MAFARDGSQDGVAVCLGEAKVLGDWHREKRANAQSRRTEEEGDVDDWLP